MIDFSSSHVHQFCRALKEMILDLNNVVRAIAIVDAQHKKQVSDIEFASPPDH